MAKPLDHEVVAEIRKITDRFVRLGRGTPVHDAKAHLGPKRHALTEAVRRKLIREWSGSYLPCFRAEDFEDAATRSYIRSCTSLVLRALGSLYRANGARQYNGSEIFNEARRHIDPTANLDMVRTGMVFAVDFRSFWATCGGSEGWEIGSIGLTDNILDFESLDAAWAKELQARQEEEKSTVEPVTPPTAPPPPIIKKEGWAARQRKRESSGIPSGKRRSAYLRKDALHSRLLKHAFATFGRGNYDTAVFEAFKELEVAVRAAAGLPQELIGTDLMRKAFNPNGGPLTKVGAHRSEEQALSDLFAGSIGWAKNPPSHRDVELRPKEAAELITLASYLLRVVDTRAKKS